MAEGLREGRVKATGGELDARVRGLLAQHASHEAAAVAIRALAPPIRRFVRTALRDDGLAGDAFSSFQEDLLRGIAAFRGEASLRTWAYRLAWHAVIRVRDDAWERRRRRLDTRSDASAAEPRTTSPASRERRAAALDRLRASLSLEEQALLVLRVDQRLAWTEIAGILSGAGAPVAEPALTKRFQRLKERLAEQARREGLTER